MEKVRLLEVEGSDRVPEFGEYDNLVLDPKQSEGSVNAKSEGNHRFISSIPDNSAVMLGEIPISARD